MSKSSNTLPPDWKEVRGTPLTQLFNAEAIESTFKKNHDDFDKNLGKLPPVVNKIENKSHRVNQHLEIIGTTNKNLNWLDQLK